MTKRAAIYVRVSTDKQTVENQLRALRQIAERRVGKWSRNTTTPASAAPKAVKTVQV
jgi:Resolvase, N terminal domain